MVNSMAKDIAIEVNATEIPHVVRLLALADRLAEGVTRAARETDPAGWWDEVERAVRLYIAARQERP